FKGSSDCDYSGVGSTGIAGAIVDGNQVYGNATGLVLGGSGYFNATQMLSNLVYANRDNGVVVVGYGANGMRIVSNTIYQPVGDAVRFETGTDGLDMLNNI